MERAGKEHKGRAVTFAVFGSVHVLALSLGLLGVCTRIHAAIHQQHGNKRPRRSRVRTSLGFGRRAAQAETDRGRAASQLLARLGLRSQPTTPAFRVRCHQASSRRVACLVLATLGEVLLAGDALAQQQRAQLHLALGEIGRGLQTHGEIQRRGDALRVTWLSLPSLPSAPSAAAPASTARCCST